MLILYSTVSVNGIDIIALPFMRCRLFTFSYQSIPVLPTCSLMAALTAAFVSALLLKRFIIVLSLSVGCGYVTTLYDFRFAFAAALAAIGQ